MTGPCRVRSCLKCNLINFLLHRKSPQSILQGQSKVSPFQKGQLTLAPKLRLTHRILGDWPRSFSNPDPLPTWGHVRVGRTPGMASLTPESGVRGTFLCTYGGRTKVQARPTRGPGWLWVEQRSRSSLHHPSCHWAQTRCIFLPRRPISQTLGLLTQTTRVERDLRGFLVV